jgi:hypothetical protein
MTPDRKALLDEALMRIAELPAEERASVLLDFFTDTLATMPVEEVRMRRDQLARRLFACGCQTETYTAIVDLVDAHLALREKHLRNTRRNGPARGPGR